MPSSWKRHTHTSAPTIMTAIQKGSAKFVWTFLLVLSLLRLIDLFISSLKTEPRQGLSPRGKNMQRHYDNVRF